MAILQIPKVKFQKIIRASRATMHSIEELFLDHKNPKQQALELIQQFEDFILTWAKREFEFLFYKTRERTFQNLKLAQPLKQFEIPEEKITAFSNEMLERLVFGKATGFAAATSHAIDQIRSKLNIVDSDHHEFTTNIFDIDSQVDEMTFNLDHYIARKASVKAQQISTIAQRIACLQAGHGLLQITCQLGRHDDACNLYVGRVFALVKSEAEKYGVPMIEELPGRGAPFHVGCRHTERPFFFYLCSQNVLNRVFTSPPTWALNRSWKEVCEEYKKQGGYTYAQNQNPNLFFATKRRNVEFRKKRVFNRNINSGHRRSNAWA